LGIEIDAQDPVGEVFEVEASLGTPTPTTNDDSHVITNDVGVGRAAPFKRRV
jgi:hypothetical protein